MSIGQGEDEAGESAAGIGSDDHSIGRRSLIKKVGIAGAAAWVAPVVIESMISPASAASIPLGTYALRLSSTHCDPTPVLDPAGAPPPATCTDLVSAYSTATNKVLTQSQLDAMGITISNCVRRYDIEVTSSNPKVTFTAAGSGSGNASHVGTCITPTFTPAAPNATQLTWPSNAATNRSGYFIVINVSA
jgi:hypothetical protein